MRLIFVSLLITIFLSAKEETCYTVQLLSAIKSEKNSDKFSKMQIADACKVMEIGKSLTLRCGCYERIKPAQKQLQRYKKRYKYAYIATTYTYRFKNKASSKVEKISEEKLVFNIKEEKKALHLSEQEESLKLMLQSFLYSNDLENAYKTVKIGLEKYPNKYYWNQKMAEISKWSGRGQEAIKYMILMNTKKPDAQLENELINYGLSAYQYDKIAKVVESRAKKYPTKENNKQVTYVYSKVGTPEKAADFFNKQYLLHPSHIEYLTQSLQIYMDMGDLESANNIIKTIEKNNLYTLQNSKIIAYYYYIKHDMKKAYKSLNVIDNIEDDTHYYQVKSDLGWYLKKYKPAAIASQKLIEKGEGRFVDYERVVYFNREINSELALKTSLASYNKFHSSYLFYIYANSAIELRRYKGLQTLVKEIDKSNSILKTEVNYWLIKSNIYRYFQEEDQALMALEHALKIDPNNMQSQLSAISMYIDYKRETKLKIVLMKFSENTMLPIAFYYPLASAYYQLQDINRASYYVDKLVQLHATITQSIDFKFLQADLYLQKNNENAFKQKLHEISKILKQESKSNPRVKLSDKFQNNYLRVKIYTMNPDKFEKKLKKAKTCLTKEHYDDIAYAWANKNKAKDKAYSIYQRTNPKAIWLQFANAMQEQNHSEIENLLLAYLHSLPLGDASVAAHQDGQISLSQSLAYEALNKNDDSQNAYISHLNLSKERTDIFDSKISYYNRDPLLRKSVELMNRMYLNNGYSFELGADYYINSNLNKKILFTIPNDTVELHFGVQKIFDEGEIEFHGAYHNSIASYLAAEVLGEYQLSKRVRIYSSLSKNINAEETTQLLLGGKKDMLSLALKLDIFASTSLDVLWQNSRFESQDNIYIGDGNYGRFLFGHQVRNGYPDMRIGFFGDYGKYNEVSNHRGLGSSLQAAGTPVLPKEFYNLGLDFAYGMANSNLYTRVWRPYAEVNAFYNSELGNFSYNFNAGYGGKAFGQDHLLLGANYTESVNGVGGSIFEVFLKYQFLYRH